MMKYFKIKNIVALHVFLAVVLFQACDNDESYDMTGDSTNFLYIRGSGQLFSDKPRNSYVFNITRTPVGEEGDEILVKIPVRVNLPLGKDVSVSARVNNDLIDEYNTNNDARYRPFPEGSVRFTKSSVSIKAGAYVSADSLEFMVSEDQYKHFTEPAYLLPIQLVDATAGVISTNQSTLWTFVNSEYRQIRPNASVNDISGTIANRNGWSISSADEPTLNYATCLDGNVSTGVRFSNVEVPTITVDLGETNKVSGLRLAPYNTTSSNYRLSSVVVELSLDNQNWNVLGTATSMATSSNYQLIGFYGGIEARYIRLTLTWSRGSTSATYRNLRELDAFVIE
jgi:hypothetical protein